MMFILYGGEGVHALLTSPFLLIFRVFLCLLTRTLQSRQERMTKGIIFRLDRSQVMFSSTIKKVLCSFLEPFIRWSFQELFYIFEMSKLPR